MKPAWEPGLRVIPANAKQDKIELTIDNIQLVGTEQQKSQFFEELSIDPVFRCADPTTNAREVLNTIWFCHATGARSSSRYEVRRQLSLGDGEPYRCLLRGTLRISHRGDSIQNWQMPSAGSADLLQFNLQINPTRFTAYQPMPIRRLLVGNPRRWPETPAVFYARQGVSGRAEYPLEDWDNLHLAEVRQYYVRPEAWPMLLHNFLAALLRQIHFRLTEAASASGSRIEFRPSFRVTSIETYWEFWADDAMNAVSAASPAICMLANWSSELKPRSFLQSNSRAVSAALMNGAIIKVYAKTQRRIRVEIAHTRDWFRRLGRERTVADLESLREVIFRARDDAARSAQRSLSLVFERSEGGSYTSFDLVGELLRAAHEVPAALALLSVLRTAGRIDTSKALWLRAATSRLRRRGILRRPYSRSPVMVITPEWSSALAALSLR